MRTAASLSCSTGCFLAGRVWLWCWACASACFAEDQRVDRHRAPVLVPQVEDGLVGAPGDDLRDRGVALVIDDHGLKRSQTAGGHDLEAEITVRRLEDRIPDDHLPLLDLDRNGPVAPGAEDDAVLGHPFDRFDRLLGGSERDALLRVDLGHRDLGRRLDLGLGIGLGLEPCRGCDRRFGTSSRLGVSGCGIGTAGCECQQHGGGHNTGQPGRSTGIRHVYIYTTYLI